MLLKPKQLQLLKVGGEQLANEAGKILSYLTPKDKYLAQLNPKYLSNLANIANTGKANLSTIRGTEMPSARILAFLPKNIKTGIHGYQGKSIFDPNHKDNFGSLPNFIADNKLNAVRYVAQHEELILPF